MNPNDRNRRATLERAEVGSPQIVRMPKLPPIFKIEGDVLYYRAWLAIEDAIASTASGLQPEALGSDDPKAGPGSTQAGREPLTEALAALASIKVCLNMNTRGRNSAIVDTLWFDGTETLFDYIDRKIEELAPSSTPPEAPK